MLNTYVKFKELLNKVTNKVPMKNTSASNVNCNDYTETGVYYLGSSVTNAPEDYCKLLVMGTSSGKGDTFQLATGVTSGKMYSRTGRTKSGNFTWSEWRCLTQDITIGTEFETGRIISGKKEYGTILNLGAINNDATASISFPISGKEITGIEGIGLSNSNGQYVAIPNPKMNITYNQVNVSVTNGMGYNLETYVHITMYYIKK